MFGVKKSPEKAKQGLNIIIVGCGKVGSTLIEQLTKEGHDTVPATASRWRLVSTTLI